MPPTRPAPVDPPSDGEDSAPEVLTLSSTKKSSKRRSEAVHAFELAQKSKRKRENRERDAALKEAKEVREEERRAVAVEGEEGGEEGEERRKRRKKKKVISGSTAKGEKEISSKVPRTGEAEVTNAEERMERAMREAAEEEDSDVDSVISGVEDRSDEWHGFGGEIEEVGIGVSATIKHLPDHLFSAAAAAQVQPSSTSISGSTSALPKPKPHNKKPKKSKAKELLVGCVHFISGSLSFFSLALLMLILIICSTPQHWYISLPSIPSSRAIRTLPLAHPDSLTASLTLPPARINKFLKRTLQLKRSSSDRITEPQKKTSLGKSWERRPGTYRSAFCESSTGFPYSLRHTIFIALQLI